MKVLSKTLLVITLMIFFRGLSFANGGPVDWSTIKRSGNIVMEQVRGIHILSEKINLKIEGNYAVYDIIYRFEKKDFLDESDTITYGFPVDLSKHYISDYKFKNSYIPYFKMTFQGKELPILEQIDYNEFKGEDTLGYIYYSNDTICEFDQYKRKWFISKMVFDKDGIYELRVQYKVKSKFEDSATNKSVLPMFSGRYVSYDMSPAAYWGEKSIVDTFALTVNVQNIDSCGGKYSVEGLDSSVFINGIYQYKRYGLDLNKQKEFGVWYSSKTRVYSNYILQHRMPNNLIKSITSNVKEDEINLNNLFDEDFNTTYLSAKPFKSGKNWIEIAFDSVEIAGVYFVNQGLNDSSNQVTKIKVEVLGFYGRNNYMSNEVFFEREKDEKYIHINQLKKLAKKPPTSNNFADNADLIVEYSDGGIWVKKIRITILEVSGDKSKGFGIPEIIITDHRWLGKE